MPNKPKYKDWIKKVNPDFLSNDYNLEQAYNDLPYKSMESWRTDPENNHLPDTYKLPNHPTFSNESMYYTGQTPGLGGYWGDNDTYIPNPRIGPPVSPQQFNTGGHINNTGYLRNSLTKYNPYNIIPSSDITMQGVDYPVLGTDNLGNSQIMYPGNNYKFPGSYVTEIPMNKKYQQGGMIPQEDDQGIYLTGEGKLTPLSTNPYSASTTYQINGPSHDNGGVKMNVNAQNIEAQGTETIDFRPDGAATIFGDLTIPKEEIANKLLVAVGAPILEKGFNQKFKNKSKEIAKEEDKLTTKTNNKLKKIDKISKQSQYFNAAQDTGAVLQDALKIKMANLDTQKNSLASLQDIMHQAANDWGIDSSKLNKKKYQDKLKTYNPITPSIENGNKFPEGGRIPVNITPPPIPQPDMNAWAQADEQALQASMGPQVSIAAQYTQPPVAPSELELSQYHQLGTQPQYTPPNLGATNTLTTQGEDTGSNNVPKEYANNNMTQDVISSLRKYMPDMSSAGIAGIMGNIAQETGFNAKNLGSHNNGQSTARGLIGWVNARWKPVKKAIIAAGLNPSTVQGQAYGLMWELKKYYPDTYKVLQSTKDPKEAAKIFHDNVERSADKTTNGGAPFRNRLKQATKFYIPNVNTNTNAKNGMRIKKAQSGTTVPLTYPNSNSLNTYNYPQSLVYPQYYQDLWNSGRLAIPYQDTANIQSQIYTTQPKNSSGTYGTANSLQVYNPFHAAENPQGIQDPNNSSQVLQAQQNYENAMRNNDQLYGTNFSQNPYHFGNKNRAFDGKFGSITRSEPKYVQPVQVSQKDYDYNKSRLIPVSTNSRERNNVWDPSQLPITLDQNLDASIGGIPIMKAMNKGINPGATGTFLDPQVPTTYIQGTQPQLPVNVDISAQPLTQSLSSPVQDNTTVSDNTNPNSNTNTPRGRNRFLDYIQGLNTPDINSMLGMLPIALEQPEYPPVQQYNPQLMDYTYIDRQADRNSIIAQANAVRRLAQSNPSALGALQGQVNQELSQINQQERNENAQNRQNIYNANNQILNQAQLQNIQFASIAQQQKDMAIANTRNRKEQALANYITNNNKDRLQQQQIAMYQSMMPNYKFNRLTNQWEKLGPDPTWTPSQVWTGGIRNQFNSFQEFEKAMKSQGRKVTQEDYNKYLEMQDMMLRGYNQYGVPISDKGSNDNDDNNKDKTTTTAKYGAVLKKFSKMRPK